MKTLYICAILLSLTAVLLHCNNRFLKLPTNLGLIILSLGSAGALAVLQWLGFSFVGEFANTVLSNIDLNEAVIVGFLCLILFVGAIYVDLPALLKEFTPIISLATIGVLISTLVVGTVVYLIALAIGLSIPWIYCLTFGALISPTDAVTVLSFLKGTDLPRSIESKITGESLLNDGMSIVLFITLLNIALGTNEANLVILPFVVMLHIVIATAIGALCAYCTSLLIKSSDVNNVYLAIIATLALATGSYSIADTLGISGPIAVVAAGLFLGNKGNIFNDDKSNSLGNFWTLIDEILNSVLFVIIGLELLAISTDGKHLALGLIAIPVVLTARYLSILSITKTLKKHRSFDSGVNYIMTWGGLRGGISIALVLSLPASEIREILMTATYMVVIFSIFVQGPTLPRLVKSLHSS